MSNVFYDYHQKDENRIQREREYSRIMTAAVISERFRNLLLSNPGLAIKNGFNGEAFPLAADESRRISAIRAATLAEFAHKMNSLNQVAAIHLAGVE
jgi:hypothetical protein